MNPWKKRPYSEMGDDSVYSLSATMLINAILELTYNGVSSKYFGQSAREGRLSAFKWINSNSKNSEFSFINVCEELNIDPSYIRKKLKDIYQITFSCEQLPRDIKIDLYAQPAATSDDNLDWNTMYRLGSHLYMGGYRERLLP